MFSRRIRTVAGTSLVATALGLAAFAAAGPANADDDYCVTYLNVTQCFDD